MQNLNPFPCARRPTVLLADDHPMMLEGLQRLLEPDLEVIGTVRDGRALVESAERDRPDLVITDISMPGTDGLEATRRLRTTAPGVRVLILSIHTEASWVRAAFAAGVCGYLTKASAADEIETAVRQVLADRFYVSPRVARAAIQPVGEEALPARAERPPVVAGETLTPRELEILPLVARGLGNKAIAHRLGVSVTTVRSHLSNVYEKLRLESRVELALYASQTDGAVM
jgi:DNA-binding NarL/FixJ family response regulator